MDVGERREMRAPLEIVYQDESLVAINKPSGLLVHRSRIATQANTFAVQMLRDQIQKPVYLIHRLDRPTSGVLLFALDSETARKVSLQFAEKQVTKQYLAVVRGHSPNRGTWDEPLQEKLDRCSDTRAESDKPPQNAVTQFESLKHWTVPFAVNKYPTSRYSLVRVFPKTGRKHQIRRHFNHMAYPILGDTTHGDRRHNRAFREHFGINRLLLAAVELRFRHPYSNRQLSIKANVGEEYELALSQLDKHAM